MKYKCISDVVRSSDENGDFEEPTRVFEKGKVYESYYNTDLIADSNGNPHILPNHIIVGCFEKIKEK